MKGLYLIALVDSHKKTVTDSGTVKEETDILELKTTETAENNYNYKPKHTSRC